MGTILEALRELNNKRLIETKQKYKIIWYDCTATRERRSETLADVETDWHEETLTFDSDLECLYYVIEDIYYEGFYKHDEIVEEFETLEDCISFLEGTDPGDGSPIVLLVEGPNGVLYDFGIHTKEDYINEFEIRR